MIFLGFAKTTSIFGVCLKSLIFLGVTCQARYFWGVQSRCWGLAYLAGKNQSTPGYNAHCNVWSSKYGCNALNLRVFGNYTKS